MSTKEEFEKLQELLSCCLGSVRCGVDFSEVDTLSIILVRKRCKELALLLDNFETW